MDERLSFWRDAASSMEPIMARYDLASYYLTLFPTSALRTRGAERLALSSDVDDHTAILRFTWYIAEIEAGLTPVPIPDRCVTPFGR